VLKIVNRRTPVVTLEFNSFSPSRLSPVAQPIDWA
jgi:hypothetical protein